MANQEQLDILKQGVDVWNKWQQQNKTTQIDLREVDLTGFNLMGANLMGAALGRSDLNDTNLFSANLRKSDLRRTNLNGANLSESDLSRANLSGTMLNGSVLSYATISSTIFSDVDLSETIGLEQVTHPSASIIDTATFRLSKGKIPEEFLRGCGLSDADIEYAKLANPELSNDEIAKIQYRIYDLRATQALQISPLFISYSHADTAFVNKLEKGLSEKGIRFWRDIHDLVSGKIESQIDRAIRQNPTVLLVLSRNSLNSDWVQHEVRTARSLEKELGRDTLCPIALDDSWKSSHWSQRVMEQIMEYNIIDFSAWEDVSIFTCKFAKLIQGLDLFYKKPEK